ncbi:MAG: CapA family protein [Cyanobacteria bacterium J06554_6]
MVSATLDSTNSATPNSEPHSLNLEQVKQYAAAGYFRAIALWINQPLVPYGIYAQVKPDDRPGCLRIVLEFKRPPQKERLVRLLCSRLWQLRSELIEGANITVRPVGQSKILWQRRVRILKPSERRSGGTGPVRPVTDRTQKASLADRRRAVRRSTYRALRRSRSVMDRQFKVARAALLTSSVAAAFILGCLTEVMISRAEPSLPALPSNSDAQWNGTSPGTEVAFTQTPPPRANTVQAALEPVAVMAHDKIADPEDPTVTLMFGGEVTVGNLDLSLPETADRLLSGLPAYAQADVAMVNLGNPLATAGTSLQEGYHRRTRPQAVAALKEGGVDIVGLSGDRTMELGERGLLETLETLDQEGLYRVGAGRDDQEARRPEILDVKGQRIAYLSYHADPAVAATAKQAGTNPSTQQAVVEDIAAIRSAVDWVVVNYRWIGDDLGVKPAPHQVDLSRRAIDAGADLVVGYHPHQLQGAEVYKDRAIVYALGDFIFGEAPLDDHDTAALRVSLRSQQMKVEFLPVTVRQAQPAAAMGEHGEAILQQIRQASAELAEPLNFPAILTPRPVKPTAPGLKLEETQPLGGELEPSKREQPIFEPAPIFEPEMRERQLESDEGLPERNSGFAQPDAGPSPAVAPTVPQWSPTSEPEPQAPPLDLSPASGPEEHTDGFIEEPEWPSEDLGDSNSLSAPLSPSSSERLTDDGPEAQPDATLEGWGPKLSPHPDFQPVRGHRSSRAEDPAQPGSPTSPFPEAESEANPGADSGAIEPYSEPIVGPLSQQLTPPKLTKAQASLVPPPES